MARSTQLMGIKSLVSILAMASVLGFGGCSTRQPTFPSVQDLNKITVAETVERLELYAPPSGLNLSARDQDAIATFVSAYANAGEGPLYINVPAASASGLGVGQAKAMLGATMQAVGVNPAALQSGQYPSRPGMPAPVIVSYRRLAIAPMDCKMGSDMTRTFNNQPYSNFGCSQASNLAALVDGPRQLLAPYAFDNLPANKRTTTIEKYIAGEPTGTPIPDGQKATVSD